MEPFSFALVALGIGVGVFLIGACCKCLAAATSPTPTTPQPGVTNQTVNNYPIGPQSYAGTLPANQLQQQQFVFMAPAPPPMNPNFLGAYTSNESPTVPYDPPPPYQPKYTAPEDVPPPYPSNARQRPLIYSVQVPDHVYSNS